MCWSVCAPCDPCVVRSNSTRDSPLLDLPQLHTRDPQKRRTAVPGWMLNFWCDFANLLPKKGDCGPGYVCSWCAAGVGLGGRTGSTSSGPWLSGHHGALAKVHDRCGAAVAVLRKPPGGAACTWRHLACHGGPLVGDQWSLVPTFDSSKKKMSAQLPCVTQHGPMLP